MYCSSKVTGGVLSILSIANVASPWVLRVMGNLFSVSLVFCIIILKNSCM